MRKTRLRQQNGFSLVTVLSVTLLATLWLTASLANLIAVYRSTSSSKFSSEISSYADSVSACVLQVLNDPDPAIRATLDNGGHSVLVPSTSWASPSGGGITSDVIANVTVAPLNPTAFSFLLNPTLTNVTPTDSTPSGSNYALAAGSWRVITTTIQYAGLTKTVRLYGYRQLSASTPPPNSKTPPSNIPFGSPSGTAPFFSGAILSTGKMQIGNNFSSSGANFSSNPGTPIPVLATNGQPLGGDITSYSPVNLLGTGISVGGSLTAMSVDNGSSPVTAQTQLPASTNVNRYVNTSGTVANFYDGSASYNQESTNVFGLTNSSMQNQTQVIATQQSAVTAQSSNPVVPSPGAPSFTTNGTITGNGQTLAAGDYSASSLVVPSSASLAVAGGSPTRIYLSDFGGEPGNSVISQINGVVNSGGLPANFQIFYGGTGTLDLTNATINGTVYAPQATVYMYNTSVNGAIVAGQINGGLDANGVVQATKKVTIVYDTSLSNPSQLKAANAQGLLLDPIAVQAALNGSSAIGANLGTFQIRYYSEQSSLH